MICKRYKSSTLPIESYDTFEFGPLTIDRTTTFNCKIRVVPFFFKNFVVFPVTRYVKKKKPPKPICSDVHSPRYYTYTITWPIRNSISPWNSFVRRSNSLLVRTTDKTVRSANETFWPSSRISLSDESRRSLRADRSHRVSGNRRKKPNIRNVK